MKAFVTAIVIFYALIGSTSGAIFFINPSTRIEITLDQTRSNLHFNNTLTAGHFLGLGVQNSPIDADLYGDQFARVEEHTISHSHFDVFISENGEAHNYTENAYEGHSYIFSDPFCNSAFFRPLNLVRDGRNQTLEFDINYNMTYVYEEQYYQDKGFANRGYFIMRLDSESGEVLISGKVHQENKEQIEKISI
ncbi:unnamed protein product [Moneuplotes crassus]|uniref:Uncharacterized protein n=1 Tax=Euplotes crassus TaxID=5936 RepID=A0AAD1XKE9_EUPCR|nr:unnamed protein product [Moneuplotes crassus]